MTLADLNDNRLEIRPEPGPKPLNYFNQLGPEEQEQRNRIEAIAAKTEEYKRIGEAITMFESFQRRLKLTDSNKSRTGSKLKSKPLPEEVAITRGLLHTTKCKEAS